jgi:hypothetical protein
VVGPEPKGGSKHAVFQGFLGKINKFLSTNNTALSGLVDRSHGGIINKELNKSSGGLKGVVRDIFQQKQLSDVPVRSKTTEKPAMNFINASSFFAGQPTPEKVGPEPQTSPRFMAKTWKAPARPPTPKSVNRTRKKPASQENSRYSLNLGKELYIERNLKDLLHDPSSPDGKIKSQFLQKRIQKSLDRLDHWKKNTTQSSNLAEVFKNILANDRFLPKTDPVNSKFNELNWVKKTDLRLSDQVDLKSLQVAVNSRLQGERTEQRKIEKLVGRQRDASLRKSNEIDGNFFVWRERGRGPRDYTLVK